MKKDTEDTISNINNPFAQECTDCIKNIWDKINLQAEQLSNKCYPNTYIWIEKFKDDNYWNIFNGTGISTRWLLTIAMIASTTTIKWAIHTTFIRNAETPIISVITKIIAHTKRSIISKFKIALINATALGENIFLKNKYAAPGNQKPVNNVIKNIAKTIFLSFSLLNSGAIDSIIFSLII